MNPQKSFKTYLVLTLSICLPLLVGVLSFDVVVASGEATNPAA
jgi:hypothetical protein